MSTTEKRRFETRGDDNRVVIVIEFQHWRMFQPLSGPAQRVPGSTELFTADGKDVTPLGDGRFKIVMTDEVLHPI